MSGAAPGPNRRGIKLVLSDVDGTLVTSDKTLTKRAIESVARLRDADIIFALTSARPPRALVRFVDPLEIATPLGAFNGGLIVDPQMRVIEEKVIAQDISGPITELLSQHGLDIWAYQGENWYVLDQDGPHIEHESQGCSCKPTQVTNFHGIDGGFVKVVGIGEDTTTIAMANALINERFTNEVSASQSQNFFVDVTHARATKGHVVKYLAATYGLDLDEIAVIGDMHNDVSMFEVAGFSVAMGNALEEVQLAADVVTTTNDHEGFARAIETFILPS